MVDRERRNLIFAHQEWLGFVQPVGLVVSPIVMVDAQVVPDRNITGRQREFREILVEDESGATANWRISDIRRLFLDYLDWDEDDLQDVADHREALEIPLTELQTVLSATWAVPAGEASSWAMLIRVEDSADLDKPPDSDSGWNASCHARFERLLRETGIPVGLLCTDKRIRLIYAPKGESSGYLTFEVSQMALPAGRPILAAFDMLLCADALFVGVPETRLPMLLAKSRDAQAEVSTKLSRQVLAALHELLRGFVSADVRGRGVSAKELAQRNPMHLYGGLITTLMRMVFVLYAEDRGLMPEHPVYQQHYSLVGLFARLRADAAAWPDTMDQRFGAWAQLLSLFRLIHGGGGRAELSFVARKGTLFDPNRFPFLEGREAKEDPDIPMIPDATVWKVLQSLMMLDGERLSYRTLDVEQIGSVYEAVMGFRVELTTGRSIAVASQKRTGAAVVVDLDALLAVDSNKRAKALQDDASRKLPSRAAALLRNAVEPSDIVAALDRSVDRAVTPDILPAGTPVLQPTDERRQSGSHYTPRSLTEPIVFEALSPLFERMGPNARPEDVLDLKVLDPAMGSGAFLAEACRQLAARLVYSWGVHGAPPDISPDEDQLLHARRLVAQRCLYGVDRNPMAVDLGRLSLWLATFAREHEFTFVDHMVRHGDFLVGLTQECIEAVNWVAGDTQDTAFGLARDHTREAEAERQRIRSATDRVGEAALRPLLERADQKLADVRLVGDAVVAAYFAADKRSARNEERAKILEALELGGSDWRVELESTASAMRSGERPIYPFHFENEFPEVFARKNPGFDAVIGNPPFLGGKRISTVLGVRFRDWLAHQHVESNNNADLAIHFFRRAFGLLRIGGTLGLIATNTIGQGDTRAAGLRWICQNGGMIYNAHRRIKWPGEAAVIVSVVHITKGTSVDPRQLDGRKVESISAFLFHRGGHDDPKRLEVNADKSFVGMFLRGMGFTFDDTGDNDVVTPISKMKQLVEENPCNRELIFPYIGGDEVNTSPTHSHHRYAFNFQNWPLRREDMMECWTQADDGQRREWLRTGIVPLDYPDHVASDWPELLAIADERVRPFRERLGNSAIDEIHKTKWWLYANDRPRLRSAIADLNRVMVISRVSQHVAFTYLPAHLVYADSLIIFPFDTCAAFCVLQSRAHEIWVRFFGSSLEDRLRYTPSDCFETFPFPDRWKTHSLLESAGETYYEFRAALMVENGRGMTDVYNRFHDPTEHDPRIVQLRQLHTAMDCAVLMSMGWSDIPTDCEFLLDYEIDEETWGNKKKPWRYRWPDEVHDEVLARLLALNAERANEELVVHSQVQ